MIKKICKECGKEFFVPVNNNQKYCCDKCRNARLRKKWRKINSVYKKPKAEKSPETENIPKRTIDDTICEMKEYNKNHGTSLSYGQYQLMLFQKKCDENKEQTQKYVQPEDNKRNEQRRIISPAVLDLFRLSLAEEEKSAATVSKYVHDAEFFAMWLNGAEVTKNAVIKYKSKLQEGYAKKSVNSVIASLNALFRLNGWEDLKVKSLKLQKEIYCSEDKELTKEEYIRLCRAAEEKKDERTSLIMQTLCGTGMRVSELGFITVEAAKCGEATITLKGKTRTVFIIPALREKLLRYASEQHIKRGSIFVSRKGNLVGRADVFRWMRQYCDAAGVCSSKVHPHNLRHLFARTFYENEKDIAALADILGHSSINTTRIYIISTGAEHKKKLEKMNLVW